MLIAFALLTAAAAPAATAPTLRTTIIQASCTTAECGGPRRSRYRLDPQFDDATDIKYRALAENGRPCGTAARVCTRAPRTIFAAAID